MEQVLQDLNLKAYTKTFIDEKITPDIVSGGFFFIPIIN